MRAAAPFAVDWSRVLKTWSIWGDAHHEDPVIFYLIQIQYYDSSRAPQHLFSFDYNLLFFDQFVKIISLLFL